MVEDNYLICTSRRNKPSVKIDICRVCKKRLGCKIYLNYLENKVFPEGRSVSMERRLKAQEHVSKSSKEKGVEIFKWPSES